LFSDGLGETEADGDGDGDVEREILELGLGDGLGDELGDGEGEGDGEREILELGLGDGEVLGLKEEDGEGDFETDDDGLGDGEKDAEGLGECDGLGETLGDGEEPDAGLIAMAAIAASSAPEPDDHPVVVAAGVDIGPLYPALQPKSPPPFIVTSQAIVSPLLGAVSKSLALYMTLNIHAFAVIVVTDAVHGSPVPPGFAR